MNKSAIQKYAVWARNELRNQISQKAFQYGITPDKKPERGLESIDGRMLTPIEQKQRDQLVNLVNQKASDGNGKPDYKKGFDQMVEEVAYTWFNRLIAIRFMEVNDYLPDHIRVLSNSNNEYKPEILSNALDLDENHFKKDLILRLIEEGKQEELYRYLLLAECNSLNEILPVMFEKMDGYTELLLPNNLLKADSVIGRLVADIDEADWKVITKEDRELGKSDEERGQVQIIGWLYQSYNSELKEQVLDGLKKNEKISRDNIAEATQLFTPDWIVRYMVENSLGRLWLSGHPNEELKKNWKYYLDESPQRSDVEQELKDIRKSHSQLKPEDLSVADLAMGSGHILVYAFDVLMEIYQSQGIRARDAVKSILENNLYGLDIDDRAAQLAYFAIMMKAREYDRRILTRGIQPNLLAIQESKGISDEAIVYFVDNKSVIRNELNLLLKETENAKELGAIIPVEKSHIEVLEDRLDELKHENDLLSQITYDQISPLVKFKKILINKYQTVIMNPPYVSSSNMNDRLKNKIISEYEDFKNDLFSVFMKRGAELTQNNGYIGLLTPYVWMFLSSFSKLRSWIYSNLSICSMVQLEYNAFEAACVPVVASTYLNRSLAYRGEYIRLAQFKGVDSQRPKTLEAIQNPECGYRYSVSQDRFKVIPGAPVAFWASDTIISSFSNSLLGDVADLKQGLATGENNRFIRQWFEVSNDKISFDRISREDALHSRKKWFPYNKGGEYRKWYGNNDYVVNWENDGEEIRNFKDKNGKLRSRPQNLDFYFMPSVTWSKISCGDIAFRYKPAGHIFDVAGTSIFTKDNDRYYILGFCNSLTASNIAKLISPTMNYEVGHIASLPIIFDDDRRGEIEDLVKENIDIAKADWDRYETSWDFKRMYLIPNSNQEKNSIYISDIEDNDNHEWDTCAGRLVENENRINQLFAQIYGEKDSDIELEGSKNSIRKSSQKEDVINLIMYAVGTLFGRYSLDENGVIYAGDKWDLSKYKTIHPDLDNVIPIGSDEYFEDDLVSRFIDWIRVVYGEDTIEENLQFIADSLGGEGTSRDIIRKYFLNDFFTDHCKIYKKRPIYWLFDSGKKNGFKCLIYVHRYQPDTLARIRTDYVLEQQERYRSQIKHINETINERPKSEQVKMKKQLKDLEGKLAEVSKYEEKIHHLADQMIRIDLDDGIKHNYSIFQDVLAKIK